MPNLPHTAAGTLAGLLLEADDFVAELEEIRPLLSPAGWVATCQALEVCEEHFCDDQICRDDQRACAAGRA